MSGIKIDSVVKNVIKNLCCSYGWSYAAFWSYGQQDSILLSLQDTYFEEEFRSLMDNLLLQVPLGGGIIGQAAHTNKHMWMCSEDHYRDQIFSGSIWDMFLNDYELRCQFSSGMKTIAVIPVEPQGVVQFGSSEKILESVEFVNQTKRMFQEIVNGGSSTGLTLFNSQSCNQNEAIASSEESCFTGGNVKLIKHDVSSSVLDELPDFGIPNEFFQTGEFNVSQWFPPLNPINYDGKQESLTVSGSEVDLFGNSGDLRDILAPILNGSQPGRNSFGNVDHTALGPKERLFSKLGIQELLEGVSGISNAGSSSCLEGQVSVKRRKTGNCMWEEAMHKPNPGLRVVDGYSMSGSSTVLQAEPPKPTKKKAKPGTRPRPKDRQQILDRMAELRQLIPNGEKMSIDCLLDRTIKHMIFMQNVMKQADMIKQVDDRKMSKVTIQDPGTNGVTWACELGNETMVCPLMVEDVGANGQMLIEMLYKEKGLFLEIADMIRQFGVIILKGVMEDRGDYIWARFIVEPEANKHVTRHEIFTSLVQFLQTTAAGVDKRCTNSWNTLLDDFHQDGIQNLVNLVDMQYCVDL
ncbi:putative transcription factor bHLH family [Helianthus annuus]|nr:putative transcription factor bHLH family [Helianthus annuus]